MKLESLGLTICEFTLDILKYFVSIVLLSFRVVVSSSPNFTSCSLLPSCMYQCVLYCLSPSLSQPNRLCSEDSAC